MRVSVPVNEHIEVELLHYIPSSIYLNKEGNGYIPIFLLLNDFAVRFLFPENTHPV